MSRPGIFPATRPHLIWSLWNAPEMQDIMKLESLHAPHCCLKTPESTLLYTHTANFEKSPWYRFGNSTRYDKRQAHQARVLILDMLAHSLLKSHIHKTKTTTSTPHPTCHLSALSNGPCSANASSALQPPSAALRLDKPGWSDRAIVAAQHLSCHSESAAFTKCVRIPTTSFAVGPSIACKTCGNRLQCRLHCQAKVCGTVSKFHSCLGIRTIFGHPGINSAHKIQTRNTSVQTSFDIECLGWVQHSFQRLFTLFGFSLMLSPWSFLGSCVPPVSVFIDIVIVIASLPTLRFWPTLHSHLFRMIENKNLSAKLFLLTTQFGSSALPDSPQQSRPCRVTMQRFGQRSSGISAATQCLPYKNNVKRFFRFLEFFGFCKTNYVSSCLPLVLFLLFLVLSCFVFLLHRSRFRTRLSKPAPEANAAHHPQGSQAHPSIPQGYIIITSKGVR